MNQTKHCWQNYVDYHKCILAKGEDFAPCRQFWLAYRSLCPSGWYARWDEQRGATQPDSNRPPKMPLDEIDADDLTEAGNFPARLE